MQAVLFYTLAAILVFFAIMTVTARNPVRAAVYLISSLLAVAGLFFLLKAEFVGTVQILVYVGGIMVLFLFVIMLVSVRDAQTKPRAGRRWKAALALGAVLSVEMMVLGARGAKIFETPAATAPPEGVTRNTELVGEALYTTYLLPFEIASILLLVAMVGAVVLAKKDLDKR